jgi:hypothetical protein
VEDYTSKHDILKIPLLVQTCWSTQNTKTRLQNAKGALNILPCPFLFFCK